jgi:hypothetical protein
MDVKELVQSKFLTAQNVKESPTKIATILDQGKEEIVTTTKGESYKAISILVELDKVQKEWRLNRHSLRKISAAFGTETSQWVGKQIALTTMLMQGGKEGVVPI